MPPAAEGMAPYLAKVRERAYTVTDADVEQLKAAGFSEDEIFEQTVAVAIARGAAPARRRHGRDRMIRLSVVDHGHAPDEAAFLAAGARAQRARAVRRRQDAPLPARALRGAVHRRAARVMRGPSDWSAGERELFAGFTSLLNQCPF